MKFLYVAIRAFLAVFGLYVLVLMLAGNAGIGHFRIYYGANNFTCK